VAGPFGVPRQFNLTWRPRPPRRHRPTRRRGGRRTGRAGRLGSARGPGGAGRPRLAGRRGLGRRFGWARRLGRAHPGLIRRPGPARCPGLAGWSRRTRGVRLARRLLGLARRFALAWGGHYGAARGPVATRSPTGHAHPRSSQSRTRYRQ